jgi:hypothetical protein
MQSVDDDFEHIAGGVNDFVDVMTVVGVPLHECAEGNCTAIVISVCVASTEAIRLGVSLERRVMCAALDDCLKS